MKVFSAIVLLVVFAFSAQAGSIKELLKRLTEELEDRSLYMVKTKDGAISGHLQTTGTCGDGCVFEVTVTDWATKQPAADPQVQTFPGMFKFEGLSTSKVYQIKACPQMAPKECGTIIYCTLNTGSTYTTDHQCSTSPPKGQNTVINQIRSLLDELEN